MVVAVSQMHTEQEIGFYTMEFQHFIHHLTGFPVSQFSDGLEPLGSFFFAHAVSFNDQALQVPCGRWRMEALEGSGEMRMLVDASTAATMWKCCVFSSTM